MFIICMIVFTLNLLFGTLEKKKSHLSIQITLASSGSNHPLQNVL